MAITDNSFSAEEFKGALSTNKDALLPIVRGVLGTDFRFIVQDETEHNAFKQNFETDVAGRLTSKIATDLEKDIVELFGIQKEKPEEKYYELLKRAGSTLKADRDKLKGELETLRAKGNPSEADKARIQQLEQGLQAKETEYQQKLTEKEQRIHQLTVGNSLQNALSKIRGKYKQDLPADIIETVENVALQDLMNIAKIQDDGKITFMDKEGKPLINTANYQPMEAESLLMDRLKSLIDTGRQQQGAGSNNGSQGGQSGGNGAPAFTGRPADVKTKTQLAEYLLKAGFIQGSPEFNKHFDEAGKDLPLR